MKFKLFSFIAIAALSTSLSQAAVLPAGSLDLTFGADKNGMVKTIRPNEELIVRGSAVQSDGKIVVVGSSQETGKDKNFALARYNPDGTLDTNFGTAGFVVSDMSGHPENNNIGKNDEINAITLDGEKIVVAGYVTNLAGDKNPILARFNTDGSLDNTFGDLGINIQIGTSADEIATAIAIQPNQKIIVVARDIISNSDEDILVIQYDLDGQISKRANGSNITDRIAFDFKTNENFGVDDIDLPRAVQIQSDGKIVIAGSASHLPMIMRLKPDLSFDFSFANGAGSILTSENNEGELNSLSIQSNDQKIVAGGSFFLTGNNFQSFMIMRCTDVNCSTFDRTGDFGLTGVFVQNFRTDDQGNSNSNDELQSLTVQSDGKIIAAGVSNNAAGTIEDFAILRLNSDGALDNTFGTNGKILTPFLENSGPVRSLAKSVVTQSDGKIIVAGTSNSSFALARYLNIEVTDPIPQPKPDLKNNAANNGNGGGGCSFIPLGGSFNLFTFIFWLIPVGFVGWRRVKK